MCDDYWGKGGDRGDRMERMIYVDVIRCGVDREYVSRIMVWIYMSDDESYLLVYLIYVYGR